MRKTDKKIDNALRIALTEVCHAALGQVDGFKWLSHEVNYHYFPSSLKVICVFASKEKLIQAQSAKKHLYLTELIAGKLKSLDIQIVNINKHVLFKSE